MANKFSFSKSFLYFKITFIILFKTIVDFYRPNIPPPELYNSTKQNQVINLLYTDSIEESDLIGLRGGDGGDVKVNQNQDNEIALIDEKSNLARSIISRTHESDLDCASINKITRRFLEITTDVIKPVIEDSRLATILSRFEKPKVKMMPLKTTPMNSNLLFADAFKTPSNKRINHYVNPLFSNTKLEGQCNREDLTKLSLNVLHARPQISQFLTQNNKINLKLAFNEVMRRAHMGNFNDFKCSFDRFRNLATECGQITQASTREAITMMNAEMLGICKNSRRIDYGLKSIDFAVEGLGQYKNITHVEIKNPVGTLIQKNDNVKPNLRRQGKKIGRKSLYQKKFWSNKNLTKELVGIKCQEDLPKFFNSTLTIVDCFDVPEFEKAIITEAVNFGAKNDSNIVYLHNITNV